MQDADAASSGRSSKRRAKITEGPGKSEMVTLKDMKTGDQEEIAVGNNDYSTLSRQLAERYQ